MTNLKKLFLAISAASVLSVVAAPMHAQANEQTLRDQIRSAVRSQLHLKDDQFLAVQRDEPLEQELAIVTGKPGVFLYRVSQAGDEIKEHRVVHHIFMDADPTYFVAVSGDGGMYRIQGFSDSLVEFRRLIAATKVKVESADQAEAVADFYREVNPQRTSMTPITSLIELKQAAERQCQTSSFDTGEQEFDAWWKHGESLYAGLPFRQTARPNGSGYIVEWTVLSSSALGLCGGAPLRARLEVRSDGQVGKLSFSPYSRGAGLSHEVGHAQSTSAPWSRP
jgi:hypothetical protein